MGSTDHLTDDLDRLYERHQALRRQLPNAWNAFFARFGSLRPVQLEAVPPVLAGENVLVTAPTACGKTEAVVAPLCERLVARRWPGLSMLLVTPTRALVNDLFYRLEKPCEHMHVRVGRKTADHGLPDGSDDQLLITTPESLESLLTFRRRSLEQLKAVVLDEIHLLDGSARGDQLRVLLSRLRVYLLHAGAAGFSGLQTVAMSATVPDPRRVADAYLGQGARVISVPGQRPLQARVIEAVGPLELRCAAAVQAMESFSEVHKVLVFFNSRKEVDQGTAYFRRGLFEQASVFGHHGSLSKAQREDTETRFRSERRAVCVATMTLEVGIDIGDVDLVVCMDPPASLSSFLQRVGRGCRRLSGGTRVLCVARDPAKSLLFEAIIRQAALGMPIGPLKPFRASVLVQQVLAYLRQVDHNARTLEQFVRALASPSAPAITPERVQEVLTDMVSQGLLDKLGLVYRPAQRGSEFIQSSRIYSNIEPTPTEVNLVDADTGELIASVAAVLGNQVRIAGRSYEVLPGSGAGGRKMRATGKEADSPQYHAVKLPLAADLGAAMAGLLGIDSTELVVLTSGTGVVIFTWLGKLLNAALADGVSAGGGKVQAGAFSLRVDGVPPSECLSLVGRAVTAVLAKNPLGQMAIERWTDVGPHFSELSSRFSQAAREDWLDSAYLTGWRNRLQRVRVVEPESELGGQLLRVATM